MVCTSFQGYKSSCFCGDILKPKGGVGTSRKACRDIHDFAWCFSEAGVNTRPLFDALEKEMTFKF